MNLYLKPFEVCPYGDVCPYSDKYSDRYICCGLKKNRQNSFRCKFIEIDSNELNSEITETIK